MTKISYKMVEVDGRYYFNDGAKYVLVDTGYGRSVSIDGTIGPFKVSLCQKQQLQSFNPTLMPDGSKIGAILYPMDGHSCLLKGDTVTVDDDAQELPEHQFFLPFAHSQAPLLECTCDGKKKLLYFDSGMRLPVMDDDSLLEGKTKLGEIGEWVGVLERKVDAPYYEATFAFPCGFTFDGHFEHDYPHLYIRGMFGGTGVQGYLGIEFFKKYDLFISAIPGKRGLAIISR